MKCTTIHLLRIVLAVGGLVLLGSRESRAEAARVAPTHTDINSSPAAPAVPLEGLSTLGKQVYRLFRDGKTATGWAVLKHMAQTEANIAELAALRAYGRMNHTEGYSLVSVWHAMFFTYDDEQCPEDCIQEDIGIACDLREDLKPMVAHMIDQRQSFLPVDDN